MSFDWKSKWIGKGTIDTYLIPVEDASNEIHKFNYTCSILSTVLITSWSFRKSTLWRAWPIISPHFCTTSSHTNHTNKISPIMVETNEFLNKTISVKKEPGLEAPSTSEGIHLSSVDQVLLESYYQPGQALSD